MKEKTFQIPFDIGDKVFFMNQNQVCEDTIESYQIEVTRNRVKMNINIYYHLNNNSYVPTNNLFASKELLLKSL